MSKATITRLFVAAVIAIVVGLALALGSAVAAFASGTVTIGGSAVVAVDGEAVPGTLIWFAIAGVAFGGGALAAFVSWIGALLNTYRLEDKTWFVALLAFGLVSLGWLATALYILAGPDSTREPEHGSAAFPARAG